MKTTRTLFQPLLLLTLLMVAGGLTNRAHAQYQSFFGDSVTRYNLAGESVNYDPFALGGAFMYYPTVNRADTVRIDDKLYYRSDYEFGWNNYSCVREDTTTGQLFWRYNLNGYACDICVCDMSLSVGDTFSVLFDPWDSTAIVADSIAYTNGKKVIYFHRIEYGDVYFCDGWADYDVPIMFIEGIGPTYGPLGCDLVSFRGCVLLCMYKDDEFVFALDEENLGCYQACYAKVKENLDFGWTLFPNPCNRYLNIHFNEAAQLNGHLYITDMTGCVVYSQKMCNREMKINVRNFSAGIYMVTYKTSGMKISRKIIKK